MLTAPFRVGEALLQEQSVVFQEMGRIVRMDLIDAGEAHQLFGLVAHASTGRGYVDDLPVQISARDYVVDPLGDQADAFSAGVEIGRRGRSRFALGNPRGSSDLVLLRRRPRTGHAKQPRLMTPVAARGGLPEPGECVATSRRAMRAIRASRLSAAGRSAMGPGGPPAGVVQR
jgi:hypothetical protein